MEIFCRLTVLFEDPFWIGLYERTDGGVYEASKITFGPEPKDCEVYAYLLLHWRHLSFSPPVPGAPPADRPINPKRARRRIGRQLWEKGVGTKAQQVLQLQREEQKMVRKTASRAQRQAEQDRQYALRQRKKKDRHRGR